MPVTPDRFPGAREEDEVQLTPSAGDPATPGGVKFNGTTFRMRDSTGVFDPSVGSGGLSEAAHKALRQLIHFIDDGPAEGFASGAFKEVIGGLFPTSVIWWTSAAKTHKIVEKIITRSGGGATNVSPTPVVWKVYDADGSTVLATVSDAIAYSGAFEASRIRTIS
jgi:hypothetical protein